MGIRFQHLHTLIHGYWCLGTAHFSSSLALHEATTTAKASEPIVKLIKSDGVVNIYRRPIRASELMVQHPNHLICHSHSFYIGQKIQPLSPHDKLLLGNNYFILPVHFFQDALSFVTVAALTTSNKNPFLSCQAFEVRKAASGSLQIRVSDEFVSRLMEKKDKKEDTNKAAASGKICNTPELQKDYSQLVLYRQWKPKLETISESKRKKNKRFKNPNVGINKRLQKSNQREKGLG